MASVGNEEIGCLGCLVWLIIFVLLIGGLIRAIAWAF